MSQDTENFEALRRLLALKRYEQPPPRYFNDFSGQVIARIKAGERGETGDFFERMLWEAPWLQRIWAALEAKPVLAGVCGVAMCGLLISGALYSDRTDISPVTLVPVTEAVSAPMAMANVSAADDRFLLANAAMLQGSSTNPLPPLSTEGSLLGDIGALRAQPASFSFPAGN